MAQRRYKLTRAFALALVIAAPVGPLAVIAQDDSAAAEEARPTAHSGDSQPAVREIDLTIISARDAQDNLHYLPNISMEELIKLIRERQAKPDDQPAFHFTQSKKLQGAVSGARARLELEYEVETHRAGWTEVRLRLPSVHLEKSEVTTVDGKAKHFIIFDKAKGGYVALIKAEEAGERHKIGLTVLAPLAGTEKDRTLAIGLPQGIPGNLILTVPIAKATARGGGAEVIQTAQDGKSTTFTVAQRGGDISLTWSAPGQKTTRRSVFDVDGKILVQWKRADRISWDARFLLNVRDGEVTEARVRLPQGASLTTTQTFPGQISETIDDKTKIREVTLKFEQPLREGPSHEIQLLCERTIEPGDDADGSGIEVGKFEFAGAARQSGVLGIATSSEWHPVVKPAKAWLPELKRPAEFLAAGVLGMDVYRYIAPDTLQAAIEERRSRVTVTPQHVIFVGDDDLNLQTRLAYQVVGTHRGLCVIDLPNWTVDRVELVENGEGQALSFEPYQSEPLEISLPRNIDKDFVLQIIARQARNVDSPTIDVQIPVVAADDALPATVVLQPEDNVVVAYLSDVSFGLTPIQSPPDLSLPAREQRPIVFRESGDGQANLAASASPRARKVIAEPFSARVRVANSSATLQQQFRLSISSEPLPTLTLETPAQNSDVRISDVHIDEKPVKFTQETSAETTRIHIPGSHKGALDVGIIASIAYPVLEPGQTRSIDVPLFHVSAAEAQRREIAVQVDSESTGIKLSSDSAALSGGGVIRISPVDAVVRLSASMAKPHQQEAATVVEKAWLQSWLSRSARQDRAVFQVRTNSDVVYVELPDEVDPQRLVVLVDGKDTAVQADARRRIELPLSLSAPSETSSAGQLRRHVVELWWPSDAASVNLSRVHFTPPRVVDAWTVKTYWHVVLPNNRLAMFSPAGMEAEMAADGWWRRRRPRISQDALERWSGASTQNSPESAPSGEAYVEYLYGSVGAPPPAALSTTSTAVSMALLSLGVLVVGLVVYYVRAVRHPVVLAGVAILIVYLGVVWPAGAVFIAQAAVLAAVILLAAKLIEQVLRRRTSRRRRTATGTRQTSSVRRLRRSAESVLSPSTTATAAASLPVSTPDAP